MFNLATGGQSTFSEDATGTAAAAYDADVAIVEDFCPGGFEGCWLGIAVERFPDGIGLSASNGAPQWAVWPLAAAGPRIPGLQAGGRSP